MLLPRGLNATYDAEVGKKISGCLLHTKFLDVFEKKAVAELQRQQHFAASREYAAYHTGLRNKPDLWTRWSERYIN